MGATTTSPGSVAAAASRRSWVHEDHLSGISSGLDSVRIGQITGVGVICRPTGGPGCRSLRTESADVVPTRGHVDPPLFRGEVLLVFGKRVGHAEGDGPGGEGRDERVEDVLVAEA